MSTPELVFLIVEEGAAFARLGKMTICLMRRPPTVRLIHLLRRETVKLHATAPVGWVGFSIIEVGAITNVADDVRQASTALMRDLPATLSISVVEGSGFKSVAVRAIMIGMHLISRSPHLQKIFGDATTAVDWMMANSAASGAPLGGLTAEAVHRAIATIRARL
jgi:hypothetical protein